MPLQAAEIILAFDVGLKRTGVAVGSTQSQSARPAGTISGANGQLNWTQLDSVVDKWQPDVCVVGDPNSDDPHLNKLIRRLIHRLQQRKLRVTRVDERLSSVAANQELVGASVKHGKKVQLRDQIAACIILERYLSEHAESSS